MVARGARQMAIASAAMISTTTAWITALAFTVLNAALMRARIKVENAALASLT